jgi:hypothetical protein
VDVASIVAGYSLQTGVSVNGVLSSQAAVQGNYGSLGGQGADIFTGAMSVTHGVWLYQLTDDGLAAELTSKGTRYCRAGDRN